MLGFAQKVKPEVIPDRKYHILAAILRERIDASAEQGRIVMNIRRGLVYGLVITFVFFAGARDVRAQAAADESPWVLDFGVGIDVSLNGNVNSGAIGRLQGLATAILPNPYGEVYGTGLHFRFGGGYALSDISELRGVFTYQSADADLVRLGDIGPSNLYAQYSDYKSIGLDFGYRRYVPIKARDLRVYGEATIGVAFVNSIDAELAAPQANIVFSTTDFYDDSGAFTWGINTGVLFRIAEQVDLNAQIGLRHVGGLSEIDQLVGTGLEDINNDSARLTFPVVVGVRFRFP
jgi:Outer membrane protein beta-barrel domain